MSTPTVTSFTPSLSTSSEGLDQHARVAGKPLPKVDEKRSSRAFKSFLGKTGLIVPLRARGRGLSTAAHPNFSLGCQAKLGFQSSFNQITIGVFSGHQLGHHLGVIWGSIKTHFNVAGHITSVCMGGDWR